MEKDIYLGQCFAIITMAIALLYIITGVVYETSEFVKVVLK